MKSGAGTLAGEVESSSTFVRKLLIALWHVLGAYITYFLAYQIRFEGSVPLRYQALFWQTLPLLIGVYLVVFGAFRLYSGMWSYFSVDDLMNLVLGLAAGMAVFAALTLGVPQLWGAGMPRSVLAAEFLLMGAWMTGGRFVARYVRQHCGAPQPAIQGSERILIAGGAEHADLVIRSIRGAGQGTVVGIVTDKRGDKGLKLHGVPICGGVEGAASLAKKLRADSVLILPPFNRPAEINGIVKSCGEHGVAVAFRTIPGLANLAAGDLSVSSIREVDITDLLGRGQVSFDRGDVRAFLKGKRVMITGAGGSIGSELSRQVAMYEPERLVLFEANEYALYSIDMSLREQHPHLCIIPVAGDIRHPEETRAAIASAGGVDVIYHAAAYKHVPLMEANVPACFRTNVLGTARLAQVAVEQGVKRFVMISTDKAVRPTSVMGATKRIAERVLSEMRRGATAFVSVRFGNVLASSGSVIPLFQRQIASGGPVTVTSPEMRRFFMTIPEAVDLVLQAGTVGKDRDIMVLEMGECVRIAELAERLIELSGLVPGQDIEIKYVGLRPGEKEYEEVLTADENVVRTEYEKIWVVRGTNGHGDVERVDLQRVEALVTAGEVAALRRLAAEYVPDGVFPRGTVRGHAPALSGKCVLEQKAA